MSICNIAHPVSDIGQYSCINNMFYSDYQQYLFWQNYGITFIHGQTIGSIQPTTKIPEERTMDREYYHSCHPPFMGTEIHSQPTVGCVSPPHRNRTTRSHRKFHHGQWPGKAILRTHPNQPAEYAHRNRIYEKRNNRSTA